MSFPNKLSKKSEQPLRWKQISQSLWIWKSLVHNTKKSAASSLQKTSKFKVATVSGWLAQNVLFFPVFMLKWLENVRWIVKRNKGSENSFWLRENEKLEPNCFLASSHYQKMWSPISPVLIGILASNFFFWNSTNTPLCTEEKKGAKISISIFGPITTTKCGPPLSPVLIGIWASNFFLKLE